MASRIGMRTAQGFRQSAFRFKSTFRHGQQRFQSTADGAASAEGESGFAKLWNSPVGPKTVHFWAPIMKWGLVLTGASDFTRPAEQLSLSQNAALTATGLIWTRWCFIIKPRNIFLASVNFCLFCVGITQVSRIVLYRQAQKNQSIGEGIKEAAQEAKQSVEHAIDDPKAMVQGK